MHSNITKRGDYHQKTMAHLGHHPAFYYRFFLGDGCWNHVFPLGPSEDMNQIRHQKTRNHAKAKGNRMRKNGLSEPALFFDSSQFFFKLHFLYIKWRFVLWIWNFQKNHLPSAAIIAQNGRKRKKVKSTAPHRTKPILNILM